MGKKRRIISSPRKFGNKHRHFLDALDGVMDGKIGSLDAYIRDVQVINIGNQTIAISCSVDGDFHSNDRVRYYIDDLPASADYMTIVTGSGRFIASSSLPAVTGAISLGGHPTGSILSTGSHTITCKYFSGSSEGTRPNQSKSETVSIAESKVLFHSGTSNGPQITDLSPWLVGSKPSGGFMVTFGTLDTDIHGTGQGAGDTGWGKLTHGYNIHVTGTEFLSSSVALTNTTHPVSCSAAGTYTVELRPRGTTMAGYLTSSVISGTITLV
jgi:hypothetical protein